MINPLTLLRYDTLYFVHQSSYCSSVRLGRPICITIPKFIKLVKWLQKYRV